MATAVGAAIRACVDLASRIRWALKKRGGSARAWSLDAGRSHAQVTMMLRRLDAGETPDFSADVFEDLARAAGVSPSWLQSGRGSPNEDGKVPTPDEVGAFEGAMSYFLATETHEGRGDDARAFLAQRSELNAGMPASPDAWLAKLRDEFRAWRAPSKLVGQREILEDEDTRPAKINARRGR